MRLDWGGQVFAKNDPLNPKLREREQRAKKDTRRWCRGKVGVEHVLATLPTKAMERNSKGCGEYRSWDRRTRSMQLAWSCRHEIRCTACGKISDYWLTKEQCPIWVAKEEGK